MFNGDFMEDSTDAVSDTGPLLHLKEIDCIEVCNVFTRILIPPDVAEELRKNSCPVPQRIKILSVRPERKDTVRILTDQHSLDVGEASAITLALQEKVRYFLTDDLDARTVAKTYALEVHGTIGLVLRAFRKNIINKKNALKKVDELYSKSSLFITKDLIGQVQNEIQIFSEKKPKF